MIDGLYGDIETWKQTTTSLHGEIIRLISEIELGL